MSWCREHIESGCLFARDASLRQANCPEARGATCTLVHVILALHRLPREIRREMILALYPPYGAAAGPTKPPRRTPTPES